MSQSLLTRGMILDKVAALLRDKSPSTRSLLELWLHDVHRDIEQMPGNDFAWLKTSCTIDLVPGRESYPLPYDFKRMVDPYSICLISGSNRSKLDYISEDEFNRQYWNASSNDGTMPTLYRLFGSMEFVQVQPENSSALSLESTSTQDAGTVFIKGISNGGLLIFETVTLNGKIPVLSQNHYARLDVVSTDGDTLGTLLVKSNGGKILNASIPPMARALGFPKIGFFPIFNSTSAQWQARIQYYRRIPDLVNDQDISIVPDPNVLIEGLLWYGKQYQNDPNVNNQLVIYDSAKARMIGDEQTKFDESYQITPEEGWL